MTEARVIIDNWLDEYNTVRPHGSLGGMTPEKFLQRWTEANIDQQPKSLTG
jgi:transposase InsO family protein